MLYTHSGLAEAAAAITIAVVAWYSALATARRRKRPQSDQRETQRTFEKRIAEREAEAAMATELYALLAEHATDMVSTHKPDGQFAYVTPSWSEFTGMPVDQIVGHFPIELAHPNDIALLIANHARGLRSPDRITTQWRCRRASNDKTNGKLEYGWVETTTRSVREAMTGRVQTFVCATRDVTERKRMEEDLARSEARLRAALDGSFDAFYVLEALRDDSGQIIDFVYSEINSRGEAIISRSRADVLGRRLTEVDPSWAKDLSTLVHVAESQAAVDEETALTTAAGQKRWFHHQIIPLGDGVAITSRDVTDRKLGEEELRALSLVDDLTGLYNRRGFRMLAEQHLRLSKRGGPTSLLVCFDLDFFKDVNDIYGHAEGDSALRRVAAILRNAFRDSDIMARVGGDEFVVLALDCGEIHDYLLARIRKALDANNDAASRPYSLSLSIGTARLDPLNPVSLDDLMAEADAHLYEAKRRRREPREMMA